MNDEDDIELLTDVTALTPGQTRVIELVARTCAGAMLVGYSLAELWTEVSRFRTLRNRFPRNMR